MGGGLCLTQLKTVRVGVVLVGRKNCLKNGVSASLKIQKGRGRKRLPRRWGFSEIGRLIHRNGGAAANNEERRVSKTRAWKRSLLNCKNK